VEYGSGRKWVGGPRFIQTSRTHGPPRDDFGAFCRCRIPISPVELPWPRTLADVGRLLVLGGREASSGSQWRRRRKESGTRQTKVGRGKRSRTRQTKVGHEPRDQSPHETQGKHLSVPPCLPLTSLVSHREPSRHLSRTLDTTARSPASPTRTEASRGNGTPRAGTARKTQPGEADGGRCAQGRQDGPQSKETCRGKGALPSLVQNPGAHCPPQQTATPVSTPSPQTGPGGCEGGIRSANAGRRGAVPRRLELPDARTVRGLDDNL